MGLGKAKIDAEGRVTSELCNRNTTRVATTHALTNYPLDYAAQIDSVALVTR